MKYGETYLKDQVKLTISPTAIVLDEYPIGRARADLLVIGNETVVYEIKSDLDTLKRLDTQINEYYKLAKYVVIVCGSKYKEQLIEKLQFTKVGLIVVENCSITYVKLAEEHKTQLDRRTIYNFLRKYEFTDIVLREFGEVPENDFWYYENCYSMLDKLSVDKLHWWLQEKLKQRKRK